MSPRRQSTAPNAVKGASSGANATRQRAIGQSKSGTGWRNTEKKAAQRLTSEKGIRHRKRRRIEPEAVFGQMKFDMGYKRFRHFGIDKVKMDFVFFAIAFNLKKMCSKMSKKAKTGAIYPFTACYYAFFGFKRRLMKKITRNQLHNSSDVKIAS